MKIGRILEARIKPVNRIWLIVLMLLSTGLVYTNTLTNQLIWDDGYFLGWQEARHPAQSWPQLLAGQVPMSYGQVYRPVRSLLYVISIALYDLQPGLYHFQGILVHLSITYAVYLITYRLSKNWGQSWFTGILFGLHPIHTEAVAWITASFDTVGILFFFTAFYAYVKFRDTRSQPWLTRSLLFFWLAVFTYELTFTLPLFIIGYDWIDNKRKLPKNLKPVYLKYCLPLAAYAGIRLLLLPQAEPLPYLFDSKLKHLTMVPVLAGQYLRLMLLPLHQSVNHEVYPGISNFFYVDMNTLRTAAVLNWFSPEYFIPLAGVMAWVLISVKWLKTHPWAGFWSGWALAGLLPILQLIPQNSVFAERYTYIASYGMCALMGWVVFRLKQQYRTAAVLAAFVWLIGFGGLTVHRNTAWHDMHSFWGRLVSTGPTSAYAYRQWAAGYYMDGNYTAAIPLFKKAVELKPGDSETYYKLAYLHYQLAQLDEAARYLDQAIAYDPGNTYYQQLRQKLH